VQGADIVVLGNGDSRFRTYAEQVPAGKQVIDLVGFMSGKTAAGAEGICW